MYTYALINLLTFIFPFAQSFERRISFYKRWRFSFISIMIMAFLFIAWDVVFTSWGVWGFNHEYLVGLWIAGLPIEEVFFFITIPFACLFIYEILGLVSEKLERFESWSRIIGIFTGLSLLVIAVLNLEKDYSGLVFFLGSVSILIQSIIIPKGNTTRFFLAYLIHLVPFFIVNGILTSLPVVWYDNAQNLGLRVGSIPIEDLVYSLVLFIGNVWIYNYLISRAGKRKLTEG